MWWQAPVIPATQEAEEGESLEPGRQRLQWAKIMPLHSSLGNRVRLHLKKIKIIKSPLAMCDGSFYVLNMWPHRSDIWLDTILDVFVKVIDWLI